MHLVFNNQRTDRPEKPYQHYASMEIDGTRYEWAELTAGPCPPAMLVPSIQAAFRRTLDSLLQEAMEPYRAPVDMVDGDLPLI